MVAVMQGYKVNFMKRPTRTCVSCGARLEPSQIRAAGPFPCPSCHTQLQAPSSYAHWISASNLLFSAIVFFTLGFRSLHLLYAVLLSWFPLQFLLSSLV